MLKLKADNNKFLALTQNKLDLNILFNGIAKVLKIKIVLKDFMNLFLKDLMKTKFLILIILFQKMELET